MFVNIYILTVHYTGHIYNIYIHTYIFGYMYTDCMLGLLQCCLLPISYCLLPIARCRLTIAHCLSPSASVLEVVSCLAIYVLLDAFNFWDVHYGF